MEFLSIVVKECPVINSITIEAKKKIRESVLERLQSKEKDLSLKTFSMKILKS